MNKTFCSGKKSSYFTYLIALATLLKVVPFGDSKERRPDFDIDSQDGGDADHDHDVEDHDDHLDDDDDANDDGDEDHGI